jgi:hypothetical protein
MAKERLPALHVVALAKNPFGITIGICKECNGTGLRRCDVCGGAGEVEPPK